MSDEQVSARTGLGFVGALTIAFIVLRLTHVIGWSWWWVLSPVWIDGAIQAVIVLVCLAAAFGSVWWEDRRRWRRR